VPNAATPLTLNLWPAPAETLCDEHAAEAKHPAVYCVTWRRRRNRSVLCVCREGLVASVDRLLGLS
jgi:hypothetical protein